MRVCPPDGHSLANLHFYLIDNVSAYTQKRTPNVPRQKIKCAHLYLYYYTDLNKNNATSPGLLLCVYAAAVATVTHDSRKRARTKGDCDRAEKTNNKREKKKSKRSTVYSTECRVLLCSGIFMQILVK